MQIYDFMILCYHSRGRRKFVQIHGFMPLLRQAHKARVQADKENYKDWFSLGCLFSFHISSALRLGIQTEHKK